MARTAWGLAFVLLVGFSLPATGAMIAYEGFDYQSPGASLNGKSGGTGWTGAWQKEGTAPDWTLTNPAGSLSYGALLTSGNSVSDTYPGTSNANATQFRTWNTGSYMGHGQVVWFSFLFKTSATSSDLRIFPYATNQLHSGAGVFINAVDSRVAARFGSTSSATTLPYTPGQTHLIVGRFQFSDTAGADSLRVWLNPSLAAEPTVGYSEMTGDVAPAVNGLYMRGGHAWTGQVDELRIGTTFFDVVPVPEPSAMFCAVCGLAGVALLLRRRMR